MREWVTECLKDYEVVDVEVRRKWWITLKWYFGFCAKHDLGDPGKPRLPYVWCEAGGPVLLHGVSRGRLGQLERDVSQERS